MANVDLTQLIIRDAAEEDLPALDALRPLGALHADRIRAAAPDRFRYFLADYAGRIVGTAVLCYRAETNWQRPNQLPLVMDLFVASDMRSQGIGAALMAAIEEFAVAKGYGHLYLHVEPERNPRAFALYKRLGYQPLQSKPYEDPFRFVDSAGNVREGVEWVVDMRKWLA